MHTHLEPAPQSLRNKVIRRRRSGFTIVEVTLVLSIMLGLTAAGFFGLTAYQKYQDGLAAGGVLKAVAAAQKAYLADNPAMTYSDITIAAITPYMPNGVITTPFAGFALPEGCSIKCDVYPPVATKAGATFDPSPSTTDGQWDIGSNQ